MKKHLLFLLIWVPVVTTLASVPAEQSVSPGPDLAAAIARAEPGSVIVLEEGVYHGPMVLDKPLTLRGRPGAVIDGGRKGTVIAVRADDVRIEGLLIRNSGLRLGKDDAGIHSTGNRTQIVGNRIESCLHGIYFREVEGGRIVENRIVGATGGSHDPAFDALSEGAPTADPGEMCAVARLSENRRGNGIHLWSSSGVVIENNRVARTRDGIYFSFADHCEIAGNEVRETRYGLHYMYSDNNRFYDNRFTRNAAGAALMYSGDLEVFRNDFTGNRGKRAYGLLLQSVDDSRIANNRIEGNTIGVYAENSQNNSLWANSLAANYVALRMGGSSRDNRVAENRFTRNLHNAEVAGRSDENHWSGPERGNYWQGASVPDLDGDGVGEFTHREADLLGALREEFPLAGLLSGSPGLDVLRFAHGRGRVPGLPAIEDNRPLTESYAP